MSESKFTPGPWFVEQSEKTPIYVSPVGRHENISICNVLTMDEDDSESGDWINGDETKANAYLIAAAPDLYKALERISRPHDCGCVPCTGSCVSQEALQITVDEMRELARSAIQRATASPMGKE